MNKVLKMQKVSELLFFEVQTLSDIDDFFFA